MSVDKKNIILDTDVGVDDALALTLGLLSPAVHIKAITTVFGNTLVEDVNRNVFTVLSIIKQHFDTQVCDQPTAGIYYPIVAKGSDGPLGRDGEVLGRHDDYHGSDGIGGIHLKFPHVYPSKLYEEILPKFGDCLPCPFSDRHAVDEILHQLKTNEEKTITIVAVGPLTNIARAVLADLDTMKRVKEIIVMGGTFAKHGNITPHAEFNIHVDPIAASTVLSSGLPIILVPLDVTTQVAFTQELFDFLKLDMTLPIPRMIHDCTREIFEKNLRNLSVAQSFMHDPLCVAIAIDEGIVTTEPFKVVVETKGEFTCGMTLIDRRPLKVSQALNEASITRVCTGVNADRFFDLFFRTVFGLPQ